MKKYLISLLILILCFVCCGCSSDVTPFDERETQVKPSQKIKVYVCGAVENEGYLEVDEGTDYAAVVALAGILPQTVYPSNPNLIIRQEGVVLALQYYNDIEPCDCININGTYVAQRLSVKGIDADVIDRIADYREAHGDITDKGLLKEILGEDYQDNFYKFFVSERDYEKVD